MGVVPSVYGSGGGEVVVIDDGYTAATEAAAVAVATGTATASASDWQAMTGDETGSADALGALAESAGTLTGTITAGAAVNPEDGSWRTSRLRTADGRMVRGVSGLMLRAVGQPPSGVVYWVGIADGPDISTAPHVTLFGLDSDGRTYVRRKTASQSYTQSSASGLMAASRGVHGSVAWQTHTSGDPRVTMAAARPIDDAGRLGEGGRVVELSPAWYHDYSVPLYQVVAVSTTAAVSAEPVTVAPQVSVAAPPPAHRFVVALGQSNIIDTPGTDLATVTDTREAGTAVIINGTSVPTYPSSGQHGPDVGMVAAHTGSIRRGVIIEGAGGIDAQTVRDTYAPRAIEVASRAGATDPLWVYYQGGGDAGSVGTATAHQAIVEGVIADVREVFPGARFVLVYLQNDSGDHAPGRDIINAGFDSIAAADARVETHGGTYAKSDDKHLTSAASVQLGRDLAAIAVGHGYWDGVPE